MKRVKDLNSTAKDVTRVACTSVAYANYVKGVSAIAFRANSYATFVRPVSTAKIVSYIVRDAVCVCLYAKRAEIV